MHTKTFSGVTIKDASAGTFTAVFATLGVIDKDGDVTMPGAFKSGAQVVISAYGHKSWDGALPVGTGTITETATEAIVDGQFLMSTTHGRDTFETVKAVSEIGQQEWSYSLQNVKATLGTQDGVPVQFLESIDVKEVSPCLVGAGVNTRTLAIKSDGMKFTEHIDAVLADVEALTNRAQEVVALRAAKGKTISDESAEQIARVSAAVKQLDDVLTAAHQTQDTTKEDDQAAAQLALTVSRSLLNLISKGDTQ